MMQWVVMVTSELDFLLYCLWTVTVAASFRSSSEPAAGPSEGLEEQGAPAGCLHQR